jgi:glutamate synthase domain-containing protein 1
VRQFNRVDSAVVVDDVAEAIPTLVQRGAIVGGPHAVYTLGPAIELPHPLRNGRIFGTAHVWAMVDLLFTSETLKDAQVASQERRRLAGQPIEPE